MMEKKNKKITMTNKLYIIPKLAKLIILRILSLRTDQVRCVPSPKCILGFCALNYQIAPP